MWLARRLQHPCSGAPRLLALPSLRLFSTTAAGAGDPPSPSAGPSHFMVEYLVSSCGLSRLEALTSSRFFAHLRSSEKPDAVLRLLRDAGLKDAHIRRAVQKYPRVLLQKPEKTLEPRIRALQAAGFSAPEVAQLISISPGIVGMRDLPRRLEFWRKVVGTNQDVLKAVTRFPYLLSFSLDDTVGPRLSLLCDLGIPEDKVGKLIVRRPRWVSMRSDWLKGLAEKVKSLGFTPGSPMFVHAMTSVGNLSRSTMDAKCQLLRSFGWTQAELVYAIRRSPFILATSEQKIRAVMCFLLNEAGYEPSYVARRSALVGYSMEKKLMPRYHVLRSLKERGLPAGSRDFYATIKMPDHDFIRKFIVPYEDHLPELLEAYHHALLSTHSKANIDGS